jgi:uncharacterized membrane protein YgcG
VENNQTTHIYTEEQLMARLKFFIGICLSLTLFGIVFVVLYSLIFVTQPLNAISPIDQKFFELIIPIATFLTGTLSGIMLAGGDKDAQKQALAAANKGWDKPPTPISGGLGNASTASTTGFSSGSATFGAPATGSFGGAGSFGGGAGFGAPAFGPVNSAPSWGATPIATTASGKKVVPDEPHPEL